MMHTRVVLVFGPFAQLARLLKSRTSVHCLTSYFLGSEDSLLFFFFFAFAFSFSLASSNADMRHLT